MPLFLVERQFAESLDLTPADLSRISRVKADLGANWLYSFLSVDKKKTYCVYEAPSAEVFQEMARRLGSPVGEIIELSEVLLAPQTETPDPSAWPPIANPPVASPLKKHRLPRSFPEHRQAMRTIPDGPRYPGAGAALSCPPREV